MFARRLVTHSLHGALAALLCVAATPASAAVVTIDLDVEITGLSLTGNGSLPLASLAAPGDPCNAPGCVDDYVFMDVTAAVSQSALLPSTMSTTLFIDDTTLATTVASSFTFNVDVVIADDDASQNFAGSLDGQDISFAAVLSGTASADVSFTFGPIDPITGLPTLVPVLDNLLVTADDFKHLLGEDVNLNGVPDELVLNASDFDLLDVLVSDIDFVSLAAGGSLGVSSASLTLGGLVRDETTDPPFSLTLTGPVTLALTAVPEPQVLALFAPALLLVVAGRRRRMR